MKTKMMLCVLCSWLILGSDAAFADNVQNADLDEPFATYNAIYYTDGELDMSFVESLGALSGEIMEKQDGPENRKLIKLNLSGVKKEVWIATTVDVLENQLNVGDNVDVLGFFDETKNEPDYVSKVTQDPFYLIGFCFSIKPLRQPIYNPYMLKRCLDWESGELNLKLPHMNIQR